VLNVSKRRQVESSVIQDALATAEVLVSLSQSEAQAIAKGIHEGARVEFAQSLCARILSQLWNRKLGGRNNWPVRKCYVPLISGYSGLTERAVDALSQLPAARAGFLIGQMYTALLPDQLRKSLGAYYTPVPLVNRLLHLVEQSGVDWSSARVIDPACGGAAFLASVAPRLACRSLFRRPVDKLLDVENRLHGLEIDPFAAWMSMVLLDISLLDLSIAAGRRINSLVSARDALTLESSCFGKFDLVIGNPPYGKVTLSSELRTKFKESLFGHANLYGVFTELAVRLAKPDGVIAYVTPTSILGGEYFKQLRTFLSANAPLTLVDFVVDREGVFEGVLQETMLTVFRRGKFRDSTVEIHQVGTAEPTAPVAVEAVGRCRLHSVKDEPWLLPRSKEQLQLVERSHAMPHRLADYGFAVSTGQLVWNRHKDQLRAAFESECYPIIWAEAVNADGTFRFQAARRTHLPYLRLKSGQDFLLNHEPCVLVQRTTAKEQKRRLIAAVIPNSFVVEYPGFVVENHLNMVYSLHAKPKVGLKTMTVLLNSPVVDQVFRCISGSVAVSAFELNSLPLPNPDQMRRLQDAVLSGVPASELDSLINGFYVGPLENAAITSNRSRQDHSRVAA